MNAQCEAELKKTKSINQMIAVINRYYDLDKEFGMVKAPIIRAAIVKNFDTVVSKAGIPERTKTKFF